MNKHEKISSSGLKVAEYIRDRKPFDTHGALAARTYENGVSRNAYGDLWGDECDQFEADAPHIKYVVWSYATPIAWWTSTVRGWHVVEQKFSSTTTKHQGRLYLIPRGTED